MSDFVFPSETATPTSSGSGDASDFVFPSEADASAETSSAPSYADKAADVAKATGSGLVEGTNDLVGLPGDAQALGKNVAKGIGHYLGAAKDGSVDKFIDQYGDYANPLGLYKAVTGNELPTSAELNAGEAAKEKAEGLPSSDYTPQYTPGKYAKSIAKFVPQMVLGGAGEGSLATRALVEAAAPGAASQYAGDMLGDSPYTPYAQAAAAVAGTVLAHGAVSGAGAASRALEPMTESGQKLRAGTELMQGVADPVKAGKISYDPSTLPEGFNPTPGQITGDKGILSMQKAADLKASSQVGGANPFLDRRQNQNATVSTTLSNAQPTGDYAAVADTFKSRMQALDDKISAYQDAHTAGVQGRVTDLGGQSGPGVTGNQIAAAVRPDADAAVMAQRSALDGIGTDQGAGTPEAYGAALRPPEAQGIDALRQQRNAMYRAIGNENTNLVTTGPKAQTQALVADLSQDAKPPSGEEAEIINKISKWNDVTPMKDVQAMDARIMAAMQDEGGRTPAWGRLSQIKNSLRDAIANGVANQAEYENNAIKAGQMPPESSMESRLNDAWGVPKDDPYSSAATGTGDTSVSFLPADSGPSSGAGVSGASDAGAGRLSEAASDPRVQALPEVKNNPPQPGNVADAGKADSAPSGGLKPNFDQDAADRLEAAKQAHAVYAQAREGDTGRRLADNGIRGQYTMRDSAVPATIFKKGPGGAEALNTYLNVAGRTPEVLNTVDNYASMSLRRAADPNNTGNLNRSLISKWIGDHRDVLRARPELLDQFGTVDRAAQAAERFAPFTRGTLPEALPEMFFHAGPSGGAAVRNLKDLVGEQRATEILSEHAAYQLRNAALDPSTGLLRKSGVDAFNKAHGPALDELPGLKEKFSTAARGQETVNAIVKAKKAALDKFQAGAAGKIMNVGVSSDIPALLGEALESKTAASQLKALGEKVAGDPDAIEGLRKGLLDYIVKKYVSNTEAGTSGVQKLSDNSFQNLMKTKAHALEQVLSPEQMETLHKLPTAINMMQRSLKATIIPHGSPTAQLMGVAGHGVAGGRTSLLEQVFIADTLSRGIENAIPALGKMVETVPGGVLAIAAVRNLVNYMKAAGIAKIETLKRDALLDPQLWNDLTARVKPVDLHKKATSLGARLARSVPLDAQRGHDEAEAPRRAAGGRVEPTKAQAKAGNYPKPKMKIYGMDISIENPKGSIRRGKDKDGKEWSVKMPAAYGYIRNTVGNDGDHVDCYVGPKPMSPTVFVIDQVNPDGSYDEQKCMIGFPNKKEAVDTYVAGFSDGKGAQRIGRVEFYPIAQFKKWVDQGVRKAAA